MDKYEVILFWSRKDDAFVAEVPELSGCSAHGESHEEALAHAIEAMRLWIETAEEFGDLFPSPKVAGSFTYDNDSPGYSGIIDDVSASPCRLSWNHMFYVGSHFQPPRCSHRV